MWTQEKFRWKPNVSIMAFFYGKMWVFIFCVIRIGTFDDLDRWRNKTYCLTFRFRDAWFRNCVYDDVRWDEMKVITRAVICYLFTVRRMMHWRGTGSRKIVSFVRYKISVPNNWRWFLVVSRNRKRKIGDSESIPNPVANILNQNCEIEGPDPQHPTNGCFSYAEHPSHSRRATLFTIPLN